MPPEKMEVLQFAVKYALLNTTDKHEYMRCMKSDDLIENIIKSCVDVWKLEMPADSDVTKEYSLRLDQSDLLITKENVAEIRNGIVLKLTWTPRRTVKEILDNLRTHGNVGIDVLLSNLNAENREFLDIFMVEHDGIGIILNRVTYDLDTHEDSETINSLLDALALFTRYNNILERYEAKEKETKLVTNLCQGLDSWNSGIRLQRAATLLTVIQKSLFLARGPYLA